MMLGNGTMVKLNSTFVSEGTLPHGSTWQMNPIPMVHDYFNNVNPGLNKGGFPFPAPCDDPFEPDAAAGKMHLKQGLCTGEWINNITVSKYCTRQYSRRVRD